MSSRSRLKPLRKPKPKLALSSAAISTLVGSPRPLAPPAPTVSPPAVPTAEPPKKKRRRDPLGDNSHELRRAAPSTNGSYLNSSRARDDPQLTVKARFDKAKNASAASHAAPAADDDATPVKTPLGKNAAFRRHAIQYFYQHLFGAPEEDPEVWDGHDGVVHTIMRRLEIPSGSRDCVVKVMRECAAALAADEEYDVRGAEHSQRGRRQIITEDSEEARIILDVRCRPLLQHFKQLRNATAHLRRNRPSPNPRPTPGGRD